MPRLCQKTKSAPTILYTIDFGIEVFKEKISNNGEDSYLYMFTPNGCIVGVFDGCGGSGAKKYEKYQGKTGAYMASRAASGAACDWFIELADGSSSDDVLSLKKKITEYIALCKKVGGRTSTIKGSMSKDFPTTAAIMLMNTNQDGIVVTCLWAGDSRCYLLDEDGLKQLTEDDLGEIDAMENLTADGVLTNVISASKDFSLHHKSITLTKPAILFAATDGCFGYFSTPMEFENLLLTTLNSAKNAEEWESGISAVLQEVAGDDFSLVGAALGFGSFKNIKTAFEKRHAELIDKYICGLDAKTLEEKTGLWLIYKTNYSKYLGEE